MWRRFASAVGADKKATPVKTLYDAIRFSGVAARISPAPRNMDDPSEKLGRELKCRFRLKLVVSRVLTLR